MFLKYYVLKNLCMLNMSELVLKDLQSLNTLNFVTVMRTILGRDTSTSRREEEKFPCQKLLPQDAGTYGNGATIAAIILLFFLLITILFNLDSRVRSVTHIGKVTNYPSV